MKRITTALFFLITLSTLAVTSGEQDNRLPSKFDLRNVDGVNYLPTVRDQGMEGPCWTFAASATIESNWRRWWDDDFTDISEAHMSKCHGYEFGVSFGGNEYTAASYLSRLSGPVLETSVPYSTLLDEPCADINKHKDIPGYVDEMYWVRNDKDMLKRLLYEHGPVATVINQIFKISYYNPSDFSSFYNGPLTTPHAITIVGWDDDMMPKVGYKIKPQHPGVWIVRNSWGNQNAYDDGGYFYVSYEDNFVGRLGAVCEGKTNVEDIDTVLAYDYLGATYAENETTISGEIIQYVAIRHTAEQDLFLTHFSTFVFYEGTSISMTICKNFDGESFSDTIYHQEDIYCERAGSLKFDYPTSIPKGDFYLIAKFHHPSGREIIPKESYTPNFAIPTIEENKMWISTNADSWTLGGLNTDYEFDLAVKLIAQYPTDTSYHFTVNKKRVSTGQNIILKDYANQNADSLLWCFDNDTIHALPHEDISYTYTSAGRKSITLISYKDGKAYPNTRKNIITVSAQISPKALVVMRAKKYAIGSPISIAGTGANKYEWLVNGMAQEEQHHCINTTLTTDSTWIVMKGIVDNKHGYDTLLILAENILGDNIEDAIPLSLNTPFEEASHSTGTVEINEPWLNGTITKQSDSKSSIWFRFSAPESGSISIESIGLGSSLALFSTIHDDEFQDIISGDTLRYTKLASAEGDIGTSFTITTTKINQLTPNKIYWIQLCHAIDGHIETSIIVKAEEGLSTLPLFDNNIGINNTSALFNATIPTQLLPCKTSTFNNMGILVSQSNINKTNHSHLSETINGGIYIISISTGKGIYTHKVIKKEPWRLQLNTTE